MMRGSRRGVGVLAQFAMLALVWGASFLFIKIGLEGLSPPQVVLGRLLAGAAALLVVSLARRQRPPREPMVWAHLAVVSVLLCVAPFLLFAWAEQHVPSGLASIYNATTPLMTTLIALLALPSERPTRTTLSGLLVGFAGVLVVLIGVALGVVILGEAVSWNEPLGALVVIAGIAVSQGRVKALRHQTAPGSRLTSSSATTSNTRQEPRTALPPGTVTKPDRR